MFSYVQVSGNIQTALDLYRCVGCRYKLLIAILESENVLQVDDFLAFTKSIKAGYDLALPMYLGGHSMGSLACIHVALQDQAAWDGLILGTATVDVEWNWVLK